MAITSVDEAIGALRVFKNVILEGPPGTGKSYSVAGIARSWKDGSSHRALWRDAGGEFACGDGRWAVTFHPSTGYEEFVEGIRYNAELKDPKDPKSSPRGFELLPGVFKDWIREARDQPDYDFLVLIDEINRANVSKVLGDLLLGMEASKRVRHDPSCAGGPGSHTDCWRGGVTTRLAYSGDLLGIPDNLYVLGTMNSSDRSIAPLDSALRRRFAFVRVAPLAHDELVPLLTEALPEIGDEVFERSSRALHHLNIGLRTALGPDSTLGHSYLFQIDDPGASRPYWIEVDHSATATGSQLQVTRDWAAALLAATAPGESVRSRGTSVEFDVEYDGATYERVRLENPNAGNVRFSANASGIPFGSMNDGMTIWTPLGSRRVRLDYVPFSGDKPDVLAKYSSRSGWVKSTGTRSYGRIGASARGRGEGAEAAVWRYSILPQLIDTVTQAYATDFLLARSRVSWVSEHLDEIPGAAAIEAMEAFDAFLRDVLQLEIVALGHGLTSGLAVEGVVAGGGGNATPPRGSVEVAESGLGAEVPGMAIADGDEVERAGD